ncbi:MAG: hypothetical protein E6920_02390 [Clostridium sp.]|uniref:hypothetical protein n=1 Tax=Clostridium sp. TaxID=1506 RepID=UPI0029019F08|nr:hypothetical protein [Clostridium sp.]MDU1400760.1 hypothetical protein [Clostridium sp.]MDU4927033.1 hypothetical protein [Clostridium sp.]
MLSATVLFAVTILDTCYRIYVGAVLGSVILKSCLKVAALFKFIGYRIEMIVNLLDW